MIICGFNGIYFEIIPRKIIMINLIVFISIYYFKNITMTLYYLRMNYENNPKEHGQFLQIYPKVMIISKRYYDDVALFTNKLWKLSKRIQLVFTNLPKSTYCLKTYSDDLALFTNKLSKLYKRARGIFLHIYPKVHIIF